VDLVGVVDLPVVVPEAAFFGVVGMLSSSLASSSSARTYVPFRSFLLRQGKSKETCSWKGIPGNSGEY
jgi:hypothetical protein